MVVQQRYSYMLLVNAIMWVAVHADINDEEEELLDSTMHKGDIKLSKLLLKDQHKEKNDTDMVYLAKE